jgi:hypothetical protein
VTLSSQRVEAICEAICYEPGLHTWFTVAFNALILRINAEHYILDEHQNGYNIYTYKPLNNN